MTQYTTRMKDVKNLLTLCSFDVNHKKEISMSSSLIHLGRRNGVGAWCYSHMKDDTNVMATWSESIKSWKKEFDETSRNNETKLRVFLNIQDILLSAGIPVLALRGFAMTISKYAHIGERPNGRLEILVPEGQAILALDTLLNAGAHSFSAPRSALHEQVEAHVRFITYTGVQIVIYQRLFSLGNAFNLKINLFNYSQKIKKEGQEISVLNDLYMGYHLTAYLASCIDRKNRIRLSWLLDAAILFGKQNDISQFLEEMKKINPQQQKLLERVFQMVFLLLPDRRKEFDKEMLSEKILMEDVYQALRRPHKSSSTQLSELMKVKGVNKAGLLWHELFPSREYMMDKYNREDKVLFGLYIKRLIGI